MERLREAFDKRGFGVKKYAKNLGVSHSLLSLILNGKYEGRGDKYIRVMKQLRRDGVIVDGVER